MKRWFWLLLFFPLYLWGDETVVESDEVYYNGEIITLIGHVMVENVMGQVRAEKAVLTRDEKASTKIDFPWIELSQAVTLILSNGGEVACDHVFLDHMKMTSHLQGKVCYMDTIGQVRADEAFVDYTEVDDSIQPTQVRLLKNVQLINLETDQYALADLVTYYPDEQLMILEGKEHRVLFFDKKNDMQISAFKVRVMRNLITKKESVQGVGDVRFVFGQDEMNKLKERFQW